MSTLLLIHMVRIIEVPRTRSTVDLILRLREIEALLKQCLLVPIQGSIAGALCLLHLYDVEAFLLPVEDSSKIGIALLPFRLDMVKHRCHHLVISVEILHHPICHLEMVLSLPQMVPLMEITHHLGDLVL